MHGIADPNDVDYVMDAENGIYQVDAYGYEDFNQGIKRLVRLVFYDNNGVVIGDYNSGAAVNMDVWTASNGSPLRVISGRTQLPNNPIHKIKFAFDSPCVP